MKILKRIGIALGIIIVLLVVLFYSTTGPVVNIPYFESEYFKKSCTEKNRVLRDKPYCLS